MFDSELEPADFLGRVGATIVFEIDEDESENLARQFVATKILSVVLCANMAELQVVPFELKLINGMASGDRILPTSKVKIWRRRKMTIIAESTEMSRYNREMNIECRFGRCYYHPS